MARVRPKPPAHAECRLDGNSLAVFATSLTPESTRLRRNGITRAIQMTKSYLESDLGKEAHMMIGGGLFSLLLFAGFFYLMMRFGCGAHMVHGGHGGHEGHTSHGDGAVTATDPVCGMPVAAKLGYSKMHDGKEYRFCSRNCLEKFDAEPARYLVQKGELR
jgi:YHS domain-containing protein